MRLKVGFSALNTLLGAVLARCRRRKKKAMSPARRSTTGMTTTGTMIRAFESEELLKLACIGCDEARPEDIGADPDDCPSNWYDLHAKPVHVPVIAVESEGSAVGGMSGTPVPPAVARSTAFNTMIVNGV